MKTTLIFDESLDKRKVTLKHKRDIQIYRDVRPDHFDWVDAEGKKIDFRSYIVIRVPKDREIDFSTYRLNNYDRITLGFLIVDDGDFIEVLFYDQITFSWNMYELERFGLFKASQRVIPNFEKHGEIFPCYINPRGFWEVGYDLFFGLIQLPFTNYKDRKEEERRFKNKAY